MNSKMTFQEALQEVDNHCPNLPQPIRCAMAGDMILDRMYDEENVWEEEVIL